MRDVFGTAFNLGPVLIPTRSFALSAFGNTREEIATLTGSDRKFSCDKIRRNTSKRISLVAELSTLFARP